MHVGPRHRDIAPEPEEPSLPAGKDFNGDPFPAMHYARREGDLFVHGIAPRDVSQGNLGDCFFMSSLAAVASTHPEALRSAVRANPDGTYAVRFKERAPRGQGFRDVTVTVDGRFPADGRGGHLFGGGLERTATGGTELWPAVFEKAFAKWKGGYGRIDKGGYGEEALSALTGKPATHRDLSSLSAVDLWKRLAAAGREKRPVVAGTPLLADLRRRTGRADLAGLTDEHLYAVLGTAERGGKRFVRLYTALPVKDGKAPVAGGRREIELELGAFKRYFDDVMIGS